MNKYSQVKALLSITKGSLIGLFRNPTAFVFNLAFPLIFIIVFGFISGGGFKMDVAIDKSSDTLNPIYSELVKIPSINIVRDKTDEEINSDLTKGTIEGLLKITNNNGIYEVDLKTTTASMTGGNILKLLISQIVDNVNLVSADVKNKVAKMNQQTIEGRKYKTIDFILPGQLGFALLSSGVFGAAFIFLILRQTLVIKRFFATPVSKFAIVCGEGLSRLVFSIFNSVILISIGYFVFGFTLVNGFETFFNMIILCTIALIIFLGFGFVVSGLATNENSVPAIANLITLPQFLLAGTFFSISNFPDWLQPVSKVLPLTYLNNALRKISFEGTTIFDVMPEIGILVLWGVVVYLIAIKTFRWE